MAVVMWRQLGGMRTAVHAWRGHLVASQLKGLNLEMTPA